MTVNALMQSTNVSRSAFYQYFADVHDVMETLLTILEQEILEVAEPWFYSAGDPVALLDDTLGGLVSACYRRGPFIKAVSDAATTDDRLDVAWSEFLGRFDDVVSARIAADQELGFIEQLEPRPLAIALNRLDAYTFIQAFGQRPRSQPDPVQRAIKRLWISSLYGPQWLDDMTSTFFRPNSIDAKTLAALAIEAPR
jgi:AcrR family transcriptional regulator